MAASGDSVKLGSRCLRFLREFQRFRKHSRLPKTVQRCRSVLSVSGGLCSLMLTPVITVHALGKSVPPKLTKEQQEQQRLKEIISEADQLYTQSEIIPLYDYLLQFKDMNSDEILWRLARAAVDKGKHSSDPNEKKKCFYEAYDYIKKALIISETNFAVHKWYAILLDYTGEYEGTKQRISNAYLVKKHFIQAIELNPKDATSIHSLGYWCFIFADMPWYQQKIAAALFTTPPTSTYDEALKYFHQAEEVDPNFYSTNLLMLGKTYLRKKENKMAVTYLTRARDQPVKSPDDVKANKEARVLLKSLGVADHQESKSGQ